MKVLLSWFHILHSELKGEYGWFEGSIMIHLCVKLNQIIKKYNPKIYIKLKNNLYYREGNIPYVIKYVYTTMENERM